MTDLHNLADYQVHEESQQNLAGLRIRIRLDPLCFFRIWIQKLSWILSRFWISLIKSVGTRTLAAALQFIKFGYLLSM